MKIIKPSYEILTPISEDGLQELKFIERIGRICYKSENKITEDGESAKKFVKMLIDRGHEAMIEHSTLTVKFICDRGLSHELVRHRLCSFAQESTRYCNYSKDGITFIEPPADFFTKNKKEFLACYDVWIDACRNAEIKYNYMMLENKWTPEQARAVLPNSLKTEIVMTANYREWRNILKLRTDKAAHPQMRELMIPLLQELKKRIPIVFDDIEEAKQ